MRHEIELVQRWLAYDPETGIISRKLKRRVHHPDTLNPKRERIDFFGFKYRVTHIIWAIHYGHWPEPNNEIDHINHNIHDNRIVNLRETNRIGQAANRRWNNPNGKGVTFRSDKYEQPWQAQIQANGKKMHLGYYDTAEEAAEAYRQAALKHHGEFACLD